MILEKRLRKLESQLISEAVILHLTDGKTWTIRGGPNFLLQLFVDACNACLAPELLDVLRRTKWAEEPGGGHMIELVRAFLPKRAAVPDLPTEVNSLRNDREDGV
jgi:hypothetical protein